MTGNVEATMAGPRSRWRTIGWAAALCLLLLPFLAMQFTDEVNWGGGDFIIFGAMLAIAGGAVELAVRSSGSLAYRAGAGLAVLGSFLLVWVNLAVGFFGAGDNPANLMFLAILLVNVLGAVLVRGRATGMSRVMAAAALVQALIAAVAFSAGLMSGGAQGRFEFGASAIFVGLWIASAALFHFASAPGRTG